MAVLARALLFKILVRQRQESLKFATVMPQIQFLQQKVTEARQKNDYIQGMYWSIVQCTNASYKILHFDSDWFLQLFTSASRYGMELADFSKNGVNPFGTLKYAAVQVSEKRLS